PEVGGATGTTRASARGTQRSSLPTEPSSPSTSGSSVRPSSSRVVIRWSGGDGAEGLAELACLGGRQLDNEAAAALEGNAHDDAAYLPRDLHRPVPGPRLHRGHLAPLPFSIFVPQDRKSTRLHSS